MNLTFDVAQVVAEFGALCDVQAVGEAAPRNVRMVVRALSSGSINSRKNLLSFVDTATLPRGADWAYGLLMAGDAPEGMTAETRLTVTENTGEIWDLDSAQPYYDIDEKTFLKTVVAWRMALRGKQRMVRGR